MVSAILVLFLLPIVNTSKVRSSKFRPIFGVAYWFLVSDFLILGWIGQKPVETPFMEIGMGATFFYFFFFLVLVPAIGLLETELLNQYVKSSGVANSSESLDASKNAFKGGNDFVTIDRTEKKH